MTALVENRRAPYEELKEILEDTGRLQLMGLQRGLPALATIVAGVITSYSIHYTKLYER